MKTLLSILPQVFNYLSSVLSLSLTTRRAFLSFSSSHGPRSETLLFQKLLSSGQWRIPLLAIISGILAWVYRAHLKRLRHYLLPNLVGADGPKQTDEDKAAEIVEREYLNWLKDYLPHRYRILKKTPIPIPANKVCARN